MCFLLPRPGAPVCSILRRPTGGMRLRPFVMILEVAESPKKAWSIDAVFDESATDARPPCICGVTGVVDDDDDDGVEAGRRSGSSCRSFS